MLIKKVKYTNSRESKNILDIQSIIKTVAKYKQSRLKPIPHSKMKTPLQLT